MSRIPHVTRRDGRYVFRRRIHFRNLISKPLAIALKTAEPATASQRAAILSARFEAIKSNVGRMIESGAPLTGQQIEALFRAELEMELRVHSDRAHSDDAWADRALELAFNDHEMYETLLFPAHDAPELREFAHGLIPDEFVVEHLAAVGAPATSSNVSIARSHLMRSRSIAGKLIQRLKDADIAIFPDQVRAIAADYEQTVSARLSSPARVGTTVLPQPAQDQNVECQFLIYDSRRFGDIIEDIIFELKAEGRWTSRDADYRRVLRSFAWITGNRELGSYDHRDVSSFKRGLLRLPKNGFAYGTLSNGNMSRPFEEVMSELPPLTPDRRRSLKTLNRDLSYMSTAAQHLAQSAWKPKVPNSKVLDFSGSVVRIENDGIDKRPPWTTEHMRCLFSSPIYAGGGGALRRLHEAYQPKVWHDAAYFAPLIWYYTHACREEICGLEIADVSIDHPTPHILIRDNLTRGKDGEKAGEKRLARRREIPLHPEIIRLGFLDYVSAIRDEGHSAVFPELYLNETKRGGAHFYERAWVHMVGWISDRLPIPVNEEGKGPDIHSIRSLGSSQYEIDGVNENMRADVMGHARPSINGKHYSKRKKTEGIDVVLAERLKFLEKYVPEITGDVAAEPIRLLPLEKRSRVGSSRARKPRTRPTSQSSERNR
ncbi:hypothetical protein GRI58_09775 [Porphyrobacter algicida]|uniref:Integrase n=1 Tax=Qipengyuania algicida TaxID=1836209 RepID=A0A845AQA0_9SPHN|nr:hypothetical protein [Qipengyuania algicida]MXP29108.1 hypothetical protein [Qipengyuania algicida]